MQNTNLKKNVDDLGEWNSAKDVCTFFQCSRSFFNSYLKDKLNGKRWSTHLIRYHKDDVLRLSESLKNGGAV